MALHVSGNFGDILDPRFQRIFAEERGQLPDMLARYFNFEPHNGRNNMMWSSVGTLPDWTQFTGSVDYGTRSQGYDTTATYLEFTKGIQVERSLFDDDQYNVMDSRPRALAQSYERTRQAHGARLLENAFSVDPMFYDNTEGVPLCSNSHTTTSGAATGNGFDNLMTDPLSAAAVSLARIQMVGFRGDQAERISVIPDEIFIPPDLFEVGYEIIASSGKVDTADNNRNVHEGKYDLVEWNYQADPNNWFMSASQLRGQSVFWVDRIASEFAMVEDFDTLVAKWRGYGRWAMAWVDWRWALGAQVS
jgi:hypothetical protein